MLNAQFIGLNLYFAVNIFAALATFAVFWLIFDAWTVRRSRTELLKWLGFLLLAAGLLFRATTLRTQPGELAAVTISAALWLRVLGYVAISAGQLLEPLQLRPQLAEFLPETGPKPAAKPAKKPKSSHSGAFFGSLSAVALPLLSLLAAALYWRRATTGLERHLRPVAYGFAAFTLFEALNDATAITTTNPTLYRLLAVYGPVWWAAQASLFVGALVLGAWVWKYLLKRLQSQLFIVLVIQSLVVFLATTVGFTFLLWRNAQTQALDDLSTSSRVLRYAITSQQSQIAAQAEAVAANPAVTSALAARDHTGLAAALAGYLPQHNLTTLTVTDATAEVLLRGQDPSRWGDSVSAGPAVRRSLVGETSQSVTVDPGVIAPTVALTASQAIRDSSGGIIGTVTAGRAVTASFVDGIRAATGLDSSVYGGSIRAATTLSAPDGSRAIGISDTATAVAAQVLKHDQSYTGPATFGNRAYLAAYLPLRDTTNTPVGMLLVARPTDVLLAAANRSIELTFLFVVGLIIISVYPIFLIARYLSRQLK